MSNLRPDDRGMDHDMSVRFFRMSTAPDGAMPVFVVTSNHSVAGTRVKVTLDLEALFATHSHKSANDKAIVGKVIGWQIDMLLQEVDDDISGRTSSAL